MSVKRALADSAYGSMEGLAYHMMVERPELAQGDVESVAAATGLDTRVVAFLMHRSKEFQGLLDWHVLQEEWTTLDRRDAYRTIKGRMRDPNSRFQDVIRAAEYFDSKTGTAPRPGPVGAGGTTIQIAMVQEGDGSWVEDYRPLRFGGTPTSRQAARTGRTLTADEGLELVEAAEGEGRVSALPGDAGTKDRSS